MEIQIYRKRDKWKYRYIEREILDREKQIKKERSINK